jgi:PhnB protein
MKLNPYLMFNGQCEAAFKFYEQCLGGKIEAMMTYGETPKESPMADQVAPGLHDKIMHVHLTVGDQELMGSDSPIEYYEEPKGFSVSLNIDNLAEAERIFHALAENGTVQMPLQETFWAKSFGMVIDQFKTPWMINCG